MEKEASTKYKSNINTSIDKFSSANTSRMFVECKRSVIRQSKERKRSIVEFLDERE